MHDSRVEGLSLISVSRSGLLLAVGQPSCSAVSLRLLTGPDHEFLESLRVQQTHWQRKVLVSISTSCRLIETVESITKSFTLSSMSVVLRALPPSFCR
jgi:hypothetical protein